MASYTGTARGQKLGPSLDLVGTRDLPDPTPAKVALFTDIDRGQWSTMTRWGHPGYYASLAVQAVSYTHLTLPTNREV